MNFLSSHTAPAYDRDQIQRAKDASRRRKAARRDGSEGRPTRDREDSEAEASSSWTGVPSPVSSDFEQISDSEFRTQPTVIAHVHPRPNPPSNLSQSLSHSSALDEAGKEADGDDEQSALEDTGEESRGRGRTRERRRGRVEDALRSSLATLLSLSAPPQTMSPAVSHTSLTALLGSHSPIMDSATLYRKQSPFAYPHATTSTAEVQDESLRQKQQEAMEDAQWIEPDQVSSEAEEVSFPSSSSDDDGTQLGPRMSVRSRAIPIPSTSRTRMRSNSDTSLSRRPSFSPTATRALHLGPASASPPTFSRRRQHRRRGQRRASMSPGPASLEERRSAKARLLAERGITDAEDENVEVDAVFQELVDVARTFMDMSPRLAGSLPLPSTGAGNQRSAGSSGTAVGRTVPTQVDLGLESHHWTPEPASSPASSFPSSDPLLGASVASIDLSSGEEEARKKSTSRGVPGDGEGGWLRGIFGWLTGNIEIKVWHLVGVAGVLIGIGLGAGAILKGPRHSSRIPLYF